MAEKDWPIYGILRNFPKKEQPYFRIQSRKLYVDVPNDIILRFVNSLKDSVEKLKDKNIDEIYKESKRLANDVNNQISEKISWLKITIRRENCGEVPIGIRVKINWEEFKKFLKEYPTNDGISLTEKYKYLFICKRVGLTLAVREKEFRIEETQKEIKELVKEDINGTLNSLDLICQYISEYKSKLLQGARKRNIDILTLKYLPEMYSTIVSLKNIVSNGVVTPCYREMRKILDNICWSIFDDILDLRFKNLKIKNTECIPVYTLISQEWYMKSMGLNHTIRDLRNLCKYMKQITDKLYFYGRLKGYNWSKRQIRKTLLDTIDYSLIIAVTGKERKEYDDKIDNEIPFVEINQLKDSITKIIETTVHKLKNKQLNKSDKKLSKELTEEIINNRKELVPAFPSDKFVIEFISNAAGLDLYTMYKNYSVFVHSYPISWQMFPYSSVLEYRILRHEVDKFKNAVLQMFSTIPELKHL